jgi:hypothetical protein
MVLRGLGRWASLGVVIGALACAPGERSVSLRGGVVGSGRAPLPKRTLHVPQGVESRLVVKFVDALRVRTSVTRGLDSTTHSGDLDAALESIAHHDLHFTPLVRIDDARLDALLARAHARSGRAQPDLGGMFVVTTPDGRRPSLHVARELQALHEIEFVSFESLGTPPPVDIDPATPSLSELQGYLGPAPGIDAAGAWAMGYDGDGIRISDIEPAWRLAHEDLSDGQMIPEPGQTPSVDAMVHIEHGTSVAGMLVGGDNGYGVTGMTPGSTLAVYSELTEESGPRRTAAIIAAAADSAVGDVVLFELQMIEPVLGNYVPAEVEESVWMATRVATDAGVVVVAAAGNGAIDLDAPELTYYRNRGDSGAIIVGAGRPDTHEILDFSTFGLRVDVQGWGEGVFTTGYGNYEQYGDDTNQSYTATFAGTSSASPIVAAAAALVQHAVQEAGLEPLTSAQMRTVLRGTGLPQQGAGGNIGPLPQVPAAIAAALLPHDAPPDVAITTPVTTQTQDNALSTAVEITASPDTAWVELSINGEVQPLVDDVPPFGFTAVDFPEGTWELVAVATNVWGVVGESQPVVLEVGWEPPATTSSGGETTGVPEPADTSSSSDAQDDETTESPDGETSSGAPPSVDGDDGGCGCTQTRGGSYAAWSLVVLGAARRRRRFDLR